MKKINKKGFTLVELLAVIVIVGIILSISIIGISSYIKNSEEKSHIISKTNLLSSAIDYAKEYYTDKDWQTDDSEDEKTCVSFEQLLNSGLFDKNFKSEYEYIVLKRNKESKTIYNKEVVEESDQTNLNFCRFTNVEIKDITVKSYTSRLEISALISNRDTVNGIKKEIDVDNPDTFVKYNGNNVGYDIKDYDDSYKKIEIILDGLQDNTTGNLEISITYKFTQSITDETGEEKEENNYKNISVTKKIKTAKLKEPVITIQDEESWRKEKNINVTFDNSHVYEATYQFKPNINIKAPDLSEEDGLQLCEYSCVPYEISDNTIPKITNNNQYYKITTSNDTLNFITQENGMISAIISDGTNAASTEKEIKKIDNNTYECKIVQTAINTDNTIIDARLEVSNSNDSTQIVDSNIVKAFRWNEQKYQSFNGTNNIISEIKVSQFGMYKANVKLRTNEIISCQKNLTDGSTPEIEFVVKRNGETLADFENKWYNGELNVTIKAKSSNEDDVLKVKYCKTTKNATCTPDTLGNSEITLNLNSTGSIKIIAQAINDDTKKTSLNDYIIINVDNDKPSVPTSTITKTDGTILTESDFHKDKWRKYKIVWKDFVSTDNGDQNSDTIAGYEFQSYYKYGNKDKGICDKDNSSSLGNRYAYENKDVAYCIRAIDKAGNKSDWSKPYYFKSDTVAPTFDVEIYEKKSSASISTVEGLNLYTNNTWSNKWIYARVNNATDTLSGLNYVSYNTTGKTTNYDYAATKSDCTEEKCSKEIEVEDEGVSYIRYKICDNAGNCTTSPKYTIKLDRTPPDFDIYEALSVGDKSVFGQCLDVKEDISLEKGIMISKVKCGPKETYNGYKFDIKYIYDNQTDYNYNYGNREPFIGFYGCCPGISNKSYKVCVEIKVTDGANNSHTKKFVIKGSNNKGSKAELANKENCSWWK